jgi:hypothetical protein
MGSFDTKVTHHDQDNALSLTSPVQANRIKMKALCRLAGSYSAAAQRIAEQTQRPLSVESIKAWTCDSTTTRARRCPEWAVRALERNLKNNSVKADDPK